MEHDGRFLFTGLEQGQWLFTVSTPGFHFFDKKQVANVTTSHEIGADPAPSCVEVALGPLFSPGNALAEFRWRPLGLFVRYLVAPASDTAAVETAQQSAQTDPETNDATVSRIRIQVGKPAHAGGKEDKSANVILYALGQDGQYTQVGPPRHPAGGAVFVDPGELPASPVLIAVSKEGFEPVMAPLARGTQGNVVDLRQSDNDNAGISVNDTDGVRRAVFEPWDIAHLPIAGNRSVDSLALLAPGVAPPPAGGTPVGPGIGPTLGTIGEVVVNGIDPRLNSFLVDGVDNNDEDAGVRRGGFVFPAPYSLESIREFQILTATYDVQFGRGSGAQINVLTRSASTQFHASAYGYGSGSAWSARNYFNPGPSPKDSDTSFASGVILDLPLGRTFVSVSSEWRQNRTTQTNHFAVPTVSARSLQDSGVVGLPSLPNSTVGDAIFSLFPFPNFPQGPYGANDYREALPAGGQGLLGTVKIDRPIPHIPHTPASLTNRVYITSASTAESTTLPVTGGYLYSSLRPNVHTDIGSIVVASNAGPSTSNAFRASFGEAFYVFGSARDHNLLPSSFDNSNPFLLNQAFARATPSSGFVADPAIRSTETVTGPLGQLYVAGYSGLGIDVFRQPQHRRDATFHTADTFTAAPSVLRGATVTTGLEFWRYRFNSNSNPNSLPFIQFNGAPTLAGKTTPLSPADAVSLALPAIYEQTLTTQSNTDLNLYRNQVDLFGSVEHHFGSHLTVVFGLRAAFNGLPLSTDGRFQNKYFQQDLPASVAATDCFGCSYYLNLLKAAYPPSFTGVFAANHVTLDPRLGFAWSPSRRHDWALRGGVGRYTSQLPASILDESRTLFPNYFTLNTAGLTQEAPFSLNGGFGGNIPIAVGGIRTLASAIVPKTANTLQAQYAADTAAFLENAQSYLVAEYPTGHLLNPYAVQFHLTLEHKLGEHGFISAAYAGTESRHLLQIFNRGTFGYTPYTETGAFFPNPALHLVGAPEVSGYCGGLVSGPPLFCGGIAEKLLETSGNSSYHSLQVEFRERLAPAGLQVGAALTYAHAIDNAPGVFDSVAEFAALQSGSKTDLAPASSPFDIRFRLPVFFDWQIPSTTTWSGLLRNWHFEGIVTLQSGMPFTVNTVYDTNLSGTLNGLLATASGLLRGPVNGDDRVRIGAVASSSIPQFLPRNQSNGAVGRDTFRSGGIYNFDLSLSRTFKVAEGKNLRARLEAFNALDHPDFGIPVRLLGAPGFGTSVNTSVPNRRLQLNLQFSF